MPSEKILLEKQAIVKELSERLQASKSIVLVDYKGINVESDTKMRADMREEDVDYRVVKNSLLTFACKDAGMEDFVPALVGSTAIAMSDDEVAPARILHKYASKNKNALGFKIGFIDGKYMDADELKALASLPSREGLVAQVAGTLNGIVAALARALNEVAKQEPAA